MTSDANSKIDSLLEAEFPIEASHDPVVAYLNHAAVAPWPQRTEHAVTAFAQECSHTGAQHYPRWVETEFRLRQGLAELIHAPATDDVALLKSTSEALSVVAHGFPWNKGDNVVFCEQEFPSNRIVWESLQRYGVEARKIVLGPDPEASLQAAVDANTRLLAVSTVQYASGLRMDLQRLGEFCRRKSIAFCVDAIQGLGILPHDVEAMHIDFLMADGHKWLLGPEGLSLFYCSSRWRQRLTLHEYGWHMINNPSDFDQTDWRPADSAMRFECGSPNMLGIMALDASLDLIHEIGINTIQARIQERTDYLIDKIARHDALELITNPDPQRRAGIVTFRHAQLDADYMFAILKKKNVVCAQRAGGIRLSPHCYTRTQTLDRALDIIEGL